MTDNRQANAVRVKKKRTSVKKETLVTLLRRITGKAVAVVAAGAALLGGTLAIAPGASAAGSTVHGCPSGAVCFYPQNAGWNSNHPSLRFWSGINNFSGQVGNHYVLNNQYKTDDAGYWVALLCYGSATSANPRCSGTEFQPYYVAPWKLNSAGSGSWANVNLTPYNSITLYEP